MAKRLIVGITGATGAAYGVRLLEAVRRNRGWQSHLVLSEAGVLTAWQELGMKRKDIRFIWLIKTSHSFHGHSIGKNQSSEF